MFLRIRWTWIKTEFKSIIGPYRQERSEKKRGEKQTVKKLQTLMVRLPRKRRRRWRSSPTKLEMRPRRRRRSLCPRLQTLLFSSQGCQAVVTWVCRIYVSFLKTQPGSTPKNWKSLTLYSWSISSYQVWLDTDLTIDLFLWLKEPSASLLKSCLIKSLMTNRQMPFCKEKKKTLKAYFLGAFSCRQLNLLP